MPSSVAKKIRDLERLVNKLNGKIDDGLTKRLAQLKEEKRENEVKMKVDRTIFSKLKNSQKSKE